LEEFNPETTYKELAQATIDEMSLDPNFKKFQQLIQKRDESNLLAKDMEEEMDSLITFERTMRSFFLHHRPSVEEWKSIRKHYLNGPTIYKIDSFDDMYTKQRWFHSVDITLYMRNPEDVSQTHLKEMKNILKTKVPGYDFVN
jgi:hypothetical protein